MRILIEYTIFGAVSNSGVCKHDNLHYYNVKADTLWRI